MTRREQGWRARAWSAALWLGVMIGLVVLLGLVALLVWRVPPALYAYISNPRDRAAAEATTRTGIIAGLAGLAALGGLALSSRTYRLTEQGQITDRYTKAIEQLGSDKLDVRLGGIYALERIAVDSKRDHPTVVEVLSAYVRERSTPARTDKSTTAEDNSESSQAAGSDATKRKPATDIQAALTVLGRLPVRRAVSRGDLSHTSLSGANFAGVKLTGADLIGADLIGADLTGAELDWADLTGAELDWADLIETNLYGARLTGTHVVLADLRKADLRRADLSRADLSRADLSRAVLWGADLSRAHLGGANLSSAFLSDANLIGAKLSRANLSRAVLWRADLSGANLSGAQGLTQEQLNKTSGDVQTSLPPGLERPSSWLADDDEPVT